MVSSQGRVLMSCRKLIGYSTVIKIMELYVNNALESVSKNYKISYQSRH